MPVIAPLQVSLEGEFVADGATLSSDDTITFLPSRRQLLILRNPTGAQITLNIRGLAGTTVEVPGLGEISVAGGLSVPVPTGQARAVQLLTIYRYLQGVIHLTGGAGLVAQLFNFGKGVVIHGSPNGPPSSAGTFWRGGDGSFLITPGGVLLMSP